LESSGNGGEDYIEQTTVTIATTVLYANEDTTINYNQTSFAFSPPAALNNGSTTNIKRIDVTLSSSSGVDELKEKNITLHAFSCNIGGYDYESEVAP